MTKVKMQGPANSSGFTHDGISYDADENDIIEVPSHIIDHAKPHGFSLITEKGPIQLKPLAKASKSTKPESEDAGAKGGDGK
jgi:hypothetical protein